MFGLPYGAAIVDPASAAINGVVYDHDGGLFIAAYDRYSTIAAPTTILFWRRVPPGTARSEMPA